MGRASEVMGVVGASRGRALRVSRAALALCALTGFGGCTSLAPLWSTRDFAQGLAEARGFEMEVIEAGAFTLTTFHKGLDEPSGALVVYIEGDGRAWIAPTVVSRDPTPRDPIGLRLAVQDPRRSVLYIARPCQYTRGDANCQPKYWSSHRFAEEVVEATDTAITHALARSGPRAVGLVGYSGGAAIAALVAARRTDVAWLVTVAGNLDHARWTAMHGVTPLHGSLNPAEVLDRWREIPQIHLAGERDVVVPARLARDFAEQLSQPERVVIIPGFDHRCCWVRNWIDLMKTYPVNP
jgi:pimeloyl-ACP methyl ester carboxylesterase